MKTKRVSPSIPHEPFLLEQLKDQESAIYFLSDAFESGNVPEILQAIGLVLKAQNKAQIANKLGVHRASLYKMFCRKGKPAFETVFNVLSKCGVVLAPKKGTSKPRAERVSAHA